MTTSKKQKQCVQRYVKSHYDSINLRLPLGYKDRISAAADQAGESMTQYIRRAVDAQLSADQTRD